MPEPTKTADQLIAEAEVVPWQNEPWPNARGFDVHFPELNLSVGTAAQDEDEARALVLPVVQDHLDRNAARP